MCKKNSKHCANLSQWQSKVHRMWKSTEVNVPAWQHTHTHRHFLDECKHAPAWLTFSTFSKREPLQKNGTGLFMSQMSFLSPNQHCQITVWRQHKALTPTTGLASSFFIHYRTLEASGTATCMPAVQCQYHLILRSDWCNTLVWRDVFPHANHSTNLTHKHKQTPEHLDCQQKNYPAWKE